MKFLGKPKKPLTAEEIETKRRCARRLAERYRVSDNHAREAVDEALRFIYDGEGPAGTVVSPNQMEGAPWMIAAIQVAEEEAAEAGEG